MPQYRVIRSFGGNTRESKVELTAKDAANLIDAGYVEEIGGSKPATTTRKRAAKKTAAPAPLAVEPSES